MKIMLFQVRPVRVLLAVMLIAGSQVCLFANGTLSSKALQGRLITTSNRPVWVNGGESVTGTVILSGAQVMTPAASFATVQLDNLGTVMIAPSSAVTLSFDAKNVTVKVASGDATLTTVNGVKGTVLGANGASLPAAAPAGGNSAKNWGIAGVALGGGALIWAIIGWNKANNAEDDAKAAQASAATLASQLAALRTCLAGQTTSPLKLCTSF